MGWLAKNVEGIYSPREVNGKVEKAATVGILMGSDVGIVIYMMALLSLGVPVSNFPIKKREWLLTVLLRLYCFLHV